MSPKARGTRTFSPFALLQDMPRKNIYQKCVVFISIFLEFGRQVMFMLRHHKWPLFTLAARRGQEQTDLTNNAFSHQRKNQACTDTFPALV